VGFVVDKQALRQASSEYFGSLATHSTDCSTLTIIQGWYNRPVVASVIADSVPLNPNIFKKGGYIIKWNSVLEKIPVTQLLEGFPAFYRIRRFWVVTRAVSVLILSDI
jgi:hypothetical protein